MPGDPVEALSADDRWQVLSAATGQSRAWLTARGLRRSDQVERVLGSEASALAKRLARQVLGHRPLAQVVGEAGFYGRSFWVNRDVLIPRPDSECLIDAGLEWLSTRRTRRQSPLRMLDLGTGTGCLAVTLALEARDRGWSTEVVATDLSAAALRLARCNALWLGAGVRFYCGDWDRALPLTQGRFDLIVSNPPYLPPDDPHLSHAGMQHEPRLALVGLGQNEAGLAAYPQLVGAARSWLEPGGLLLVEHGWTQQPELVTLFRGAGLHSIRCIQDLAGRPRAVGAHL